MTKVILLVYLLTVTVLTVIASKARYDNYKVVQVKIATPSQLKAVRQMESMGYIFMNSIPQRVNTASDIAVPPHKLAEFEEIVNSAKLSVRILTMNLQNEIDQESAGQLNSRSSDSTFSWTSYHTFEQINAWLDSIAAQYPGIVTLFSIGNSYEARPLRVLKISYKPNNPAIFIESNIHAREWITSATATWIINELLTSKDPAVRDFAEKIDWYFMVIANPDGFVYSHTTARLWRKTRRPNPRSNCVGTDPNRNWGYFFGGAGTSGNPCSEAYRGPQAFSEPETEALASFISSISSRLKIYLSFHSYLQLLMYPFGVIAAGNATNEYELRTVAEAVVGKLAERHGTEYKFGRITKTLYQAAGNTIDWVMDTHQIPLTYLYEFRDTGKYGFILPSEQIIPNSEEVFDSIMEMCRQAKALRYI